MESPLPVAFCPPCTFSPAPRDQFRVARRGLVPAVRARGIVATAPQPTPPAATPSGRTASRPPRHSGSLPVVPDAGLATRADVTGTLCTNLFPLPILGGYGWFLNVYRRDKAAALSGPFVLRFIKSRISLFFRPEQGRAPASDSCKPFRGAAAGNLNVASLLADPDKPHELRCFEGGGRELFSQRYNELHTNIAVASDEEEEFLCGVEQAPTYRTVRSGPFELRSLFPSGGEQLREPPVLEWFSLNLFPLVPLADYAAFVAVWRQRRATAPVSIDKMGTQVHLSAFDPLPLPDSVPDPAPPLGAAAVRSFTGAVSNTSASAQYEALVADIEADDSVRLVSKLGDYRIVVDNSPNTFTWDRRSEVWVEVEIV